MAEPRQGPGPPHSESPLDHVSPSHQQCVHSCHGLKDESPKAGAVLVYPTSACAARPGEHPPHDSGRSDVPLACGPSARRGVLGSGLHGRRLNGRRLPHADAVPMSLHTPITCSPRLEPHLPPLPATSLNRNPISTSLTCLQMLKYHHPKHNAMPPVFYFRREFK